MSQITMRIGFDELDTLLGWSNDHSHPDRDVADYIESSTQMFRDIGAMIINFYDDGIVVGGIACSLGASLHHGQLMNIMSVVKPTHRGNIDLNRKMLEVMKNATLACGLTTFCRSKHINEKMDIIHYSKAR